MLCSGGCCKKFHFPVEPEHLDYWRLNIHHAKKKFTHLPEADVKKVLDMLIYIEGSEGVHRYTCKHFDGKFCKIYHDRPAMCRAHGETTPCHIEGCSAYRKNVKNGR